MLNHSICLPDELSVGYVEQEYKILASYRICFGIRGESGLPAGYGSFISAPVVLVTNEYLFSVLKHELIQLQEQRSQRLKSR
ncbi:hypothetical protein NIES4073_19360 [Kalymmatonema gypsitolerans NIES-4073]|nr:hypothetical protein NIES4073_19360 [Scytonema sp. NIES-4073]